VGIFRRGTATIHDGVLQRTAVRLRLWTSARLHAPA
jgi:hypothetical protein